MPFSLDPLEPNVRTDEGVSDQMHSRIQCDTRRVSHLIRAVASLLIFESDGMTWIREGLNGFSRSIGGPKKMPRLR